VVKISDFFDLFKNLCGISKALVECEWLISSFILALIMIFVGFELHPQNKAY
jgi:hypothetical protein